MAEEAVTAASASCAAPAARGLPVLRIKRALVERPADVVSVELPRSKRPRSAVVSGAALEALTLSGADAGPVRSLVRYRRVGGGADRGGPRRYITKARVLDLPARLLRRKGVGDAVERQIAQGEDDGGGLDAETRIGGVGRGEWMCNGVVMTRERDGSGAALDGSDAALDGSDAALDGSGAALDGSEDFVFDWYVQEKVLEHSEADGVSGGSSAQEGGPGWFLCAEDLQEVDFWMGDSSSEDLQPNGGLVLDDVSTEGSVDYPSTPDEGQYGREVMEDDGSIGGGDSTDDEYGSSAFARRMMQSARSNLFATEGRYDISDEEADLSNGYSRHAYGDRYRVRVDEEVGSCGSDEQ